MALPPPNHEFVDDNVHNTDWQTHREQVQQQVSNLLHLARISKAGADLTARHADAPGVCSRELAASKRRWEETVMLLAELLDHFGWGHREVAEEVRLHIQERNAGKLKLQAEAALRLSNYFAAQHQEIIREGEPTA